MNQIIPTALKARRAVADAPLFAFTFVTTLGWTQLALAQDAANVRGALDTNKEALEAVKESEFTGEGVQRSAQNTLNAFLYAAGAIGVIMVGFGIWSLYNHYKEGEQSRSSASKGVLMIVFGGLMTIPAIITAIAPNLFVGSGT